MPHYRAAWLLPITRPPIRDAWIRTEQGRIVAFGASAPGRVPAAAVIDLGDAAVLPGLVNAHTHFELSWMRGLVPPTDDFPGWIRSVIALMRQKDTSAAKVTDAINEAIDDSRRCGTALVGDISNSLATAGPLAERRMAALVFHELVGFRSEHASRLVAEAVERIERAPASDLLRYSLAPHAPYSVSRALFDGIRTRLLSGQNRSSVHLGESAAEDEFVSDGTGPWRALLGDLGTWDTAWVTPGCTPVEYVEGMGWLHEWLIVVHGVHFRQADLARVAASGATLVTCPRGNVLTGAGTPPIAEFYGSGAKIAIGTDSLASVPDLNVFEELAALRRLGPGVPARALLESATINGARALGFGDDFGAIEAGKCDRLIAVDIPGRITDVEEYLVSGIQPAQVRWLSANE